MVCQPREADELAWLGKEPAASPVEAPFSTTVEPAADPVTIPLSAWQISGDAVTGLAHRRSGLSCQDAVVWRNVTRPTLALSDGAGSAAVSELGAAALVSGLSRFLISMEDAISPWLDGYECDADEQAALWSQRLLVHARGLLDDLARAERRNVA